MLLNPVTSCSLSCPAEVLDCRWANDDPNPRAVARVQHEREVALRDAYVKVGGVCANRAVGEHLSVGQAPG